MRKFASGATRDTDTSKFDLEGFLSPAVLNRYAEYMNKHRTQADGKLRDSDNWQKGIPLEVYMKSAYRHFFDWWANHRHVDAAIKEDIEESLCALLFNTMGYLHEYLKAKDDYNAAEIDGPTGGIDRFKKGEPVKIKLNHAEHISEHVKQTVADADNRGVYVMRNADTGTLHSIDIGGKTLCFYDGEVFPVEDN